MKYNLVQRYDIFFNSARKTQKINEKTLEVLRKSHKNKKFAKHKKCFLLRFYPSYTLAQKTDQRAEDKRENSDFTPYLK